MTQVSGPTQQPPAQESAVHVGGFGSHDPPTPASAGTHDPSDFVQSVQSAPKLPQMVGSVPVWHSPVAVQQPEHVSGSQTETTHCCVFGSHVLPAPVAVQSVH
jgi:hypothetical protein